MSKSKRQPKNFFRYFVDEFILFRRSFVYESALDAETVADRLNQLSNQYHKKRNTSFHIESKIIDDGEDWSIILYCEIRNRYGYYVQAIEVTGKVFTNNDGTSTLDLTSKQNVSFWIWLPILFLVGMIPLMSNPQLAFAGNGLPATMCLWFVSFLVAAIYYLIMFLDKEFQINSFLRLIKLTTLKT